MATSRPTKSFTVRLPMDSYDAVRHEDERALERWFDELGQNREECDVDYAFAAQSEVVLRDPAWT